MIRFAAAAALIFLIGDFFMIPLVMRPLFKGALGDTMLDTLRLGPAALFYLIHLAVLVWFASRTARIEGVTAAARDGGLIGLVAYSCYEMTSWTIMRDWTPTLVIIDTIWGVVLSAAAAWMGALAMAKGTSASR